MHIALCGEFGLKGDEVSSGPRTKRYHIKSEGFFKRYLKILIFFFHRP